MRPLQQPTLAELHTSTGPKVGQHLPETTSSEEICRPDVGSVGLSISGRQMLDLSLFVGWVKTEIVGMNLHMSRVKSQVAITLRTVH